ncbi:Ig-like domain-containing protein [Sphingomonas aerolata]|uniref:Ig-like domain-containing protein n=1 Tax=Sphingomonas aerolata TaxID=185951 RepID=UPI002FE141EB
MAAALPSRRPTQRAISPPPCKSLRPIPLHPARPRAAIDAGGATVTGRGEAGATVTVRDAAGNVIGSVVVAADGSFAAPLSLAQSNGGGLAVTQTDVAGNVSPAVQVAAPDTTAPAAPEAAIDAGGATITGRGEAGATVTVRDAAGTVIGTVVVAADGSFTASLSPAQANGGRLSVTQTDVAGNVSPAVQSLLRPIPPHPVRPRRRSTLVVRPSPGAVKRVRPSRCVMLRAR